MPARRGDSSPRARAGTGGMGASHRRDRPIDRRTTDPLRCNAVARGHDIASSQVMKMRSVSIVAMLGGVLVALSPRRRAVLARRLAEARRAVSQRLADRDREASRSTERWDDDGGATQGGNNAII